MIYVNPGRTSSAAADGRGWPTAYPTLETALSAAATTASAAQPVAIMLATGNYVPASAGGFQLISHVRLYGGYPIQNDQDTGIYGVTETVLSGEAGDGGTMTGQVTSVNPDPGAKPVPGEAAWTNNRKILNGENLADVKLSNLVIAGGAAYNNHKPGGAEPEVTTMPHTRGCCATPS